jgi:hypothetical protein
MLIDVEVENFRSYRERKRFSLVAASGKELPQNLMELPDLNLTLVRAAVIYGPNASGKSNLLAAMKCVSELLEFPTNRQLGTSLVFAPFRLDPSFWRRPSTFRVRFLIERVLYDYSIAVGPRIVEEERLVVHPRGKPQEWFRRKGADIEFNSTHLKGQKQSLRAMTPEDVPLLAVAAAFGHAQLSPPARWLASNLRDRFNSLDFFPRSLPGGNGAPDATAELCNNDKTFREWATRFLRHADLGIQDLLVDVTKERGLASSARRSDESTSEPGVVPTQELYEPYFIHSGGGGFKARFGLFDESQGTRRLFDMLIPLHTLLVDGQVAILDELGSSLHPSLVRELIRAFHDPKLNPNSAQLIFATHDTSLLSGKLFRRDQVWFTEKDRGGATDLYSLQDLKGVRDDEPFEKGYIRGRYGAIPFFGELDFPQVSEEPSRAVT